MIHNCEHHKEILTNTLGSTAVKSCMSGSALWSTLAQEHYQVDFISGQGLFFQLSVKVLMEENLHLKFVSEAKLKGMVNLL